MNNEQLKIISLEQTHEDHKLKAKPRKTPLDHFKQCPQCGDSELTPIGPDVVCMECCWDSTAWDVSQGGMDNAFYAAKEYGFNFLSSIPGNENKKQIIKNNPLTNEQGA